MTEQAKQAVKEMKRKGSPDAGTKALAIVAKLVVILASVGIFVYVIETARWFVRILAGMPSFIALISIIVFGVGELIWVIVVSEDAIPRDRATVLRTALRRLGWEGAVAALLILVPKGVVSVVAEIAPQVLFRPLEIVAAAAGVLIAGVAFVVSRRTLRG